MLKTNSLVRGGKAKGRRAEGQKGAGRRAPDCYREGEGL